VPIDPSQLDSLATVEIGVTPSAPLYEGDTLEDVTVVAEGFEPDGTPINPADFTGWSAEVIMDSGDTLAPTVDSPLDATGQIVLRLALGESTDKVGKHRGNVRIFMPDPARTQQRTVFNFVIAITESPP